MANNKREIADPDEKTPAMTTYMPNSLKVRHQKVCLFLGVSQSRRVRTLLEADCVAFDGGVVKTDFDFDGAQALRKKYKSSEDQNFKLLQTEILPNRKTAYETLVGFAKTFGTDDPLVLKIDDVLEQLKLHNYLGSEPFSDSSLMTFIFYVEAVVARRKVDSEIKLHWRHVPKKPSVPLPLPEKVEEES